MLEWLINLTLDHNPIEEIEDYAFVNCSQLMSLSLSHCRLKAIKNRNFVGLDNLEALYLDHNLIDSFQIETRKGWFEIKSAKMTDQELSIVHAHLFCVSYPRRSVLGNVQLQGNQFTKIDLRLFSNIDGLHGCLKIDLSSNKIVEINDQLTFNRCMDLNLSKNRLSYISPNAFGALVNLNLKDNPIREFGADLSKPIDISNSTCGKKMVEAIFSSSKLPPVVGLEGISHVSVDKKAFIISSSRPQAIRSLINEEKFDLKKMKNLTLNNCLNATNGDLEILSQFQDAEKLDLRWNNLDRINVDWLQSMSNLQELDLRGNQIQTLDDANLFANCPNLLELDLSKNRVRSINRRLFHGLYKLTRLDLSDNHGLSTIDDGLFRSLFSVSEIFLNGNIIQRLNLPRLFKSCRHLDRLDLSNNQLDNRTFSRENMGQLVDLKILCLNYNQLENIEFVRDMAQLEKLELNNNLIESIEKDGCNLLGRLRSLKQLDLSGNRIQSLSKDLFAHLENQLIGLDVSGNLFDSEPGLGLRLYDHLEGLKRVEPTPIYRRRRDRSRQSSGWMKIPIVHTW